MRVLVTGASGFVGGAICARLIEQGDEVHALVRREGSAPAGTTAVRGDLADAASLQAAVASAAPDLVFHLAAEIASQRSEERIHEVNVDGTRRLVEACLAAPAPPKLVFTSTVVTGEAGGALLDEETPLVVQTPYGRSKQEGERIVLGAGLRATVIRPSHVYGPGGWYAEEMVARLRAPGLARLHASRPRRAGRAALTANHRGGAGPRPELWLLGNHGPGRRLDRARHQGDGR